MATTTLPRPSTATVTPLRATIEKEGTTTTTNLSDQEILAELERAAEQVVDENFDEECLVDEEGGPVDELCVDEGLYTRTKGRFKKLVRGTLGLVRGSDDTDVDDDDDYLFGSGVFDSDEVPEGELLEKGWESRGNSSALRRNAEVWNFALKCVFKALKARKLTKAGIATESDISASKVEAATYIRDGFLRLGPTFVKLGQVISTRTDILPKEYTDILKTLQDDVPGFSGKRAKDILSKELGKPCDTVFQNFSEEPLAAASLGQVHTAMYKGKKVAIKVQRAGLKELFDVDLKNLKKLAELLDKFDPKTDGELAPSISMIAKSHIYQALHILNHFILTSHHRCRSKLGINLRRIRTLTLPRNRLHQRSFELRTICT